MTVLTGASYRQTPVRVWSVASGLHLFVIFVLGWGFIVLAPPGSQVAAWWPAAGASAIFVFRVRTSERLYAYALLIASTALSNLVAERPPVVSICFGVANAAEVAVMVGVVTWRSPARPVLSSLARASRFFAAALLGAIVIGVLAGCTVAVLEHGNFLLTVAGVSAAHATAMFVIGPFALLPIWRFANARAVEISVQATILAAVVVLVFSPNQQLPLAFLPIPLLAWAAFRLEAVVLSIEVVALALGVSILTAMGWGPFAVVGNVSRPATLLIQIFLLTTASFAVLVNAAQYERRAVATRLASREQLLRGGFVQSRVGLMIIEAGPKGLVVVERNRIVEQVLASELSTRSDDPALLDWSGAVAGDFLSTVRAGGEEFSTTLHAESGDVDLDVLVNALEGSPSLFTVQLIDATEARKTVRTQQDALEREQRAIANLEELHRQKDEFVASASHELRTPITSILGFAEILTDMHDLPPLGAKSAATIHRNAKRLADLVEDILLLGSPIKTPLGNSRADLAATISDVIESLAPMAAQTKSTVRLGAHVEATTVTVSAPDLSRILTNLISNGLKYSGEGGTVTVSSTSTDGQVVVEISDDGAGMPEEVLARVFERFYRAPGTEGKNIFGTGLGLSLVRRLVNGAGGQVELISSPGQGTSAFVTLLRTGRVDREEESLHG